MHQETLALTKSASLSTLAPFRIKPFRGIGAAPAHVDKFEPLRLAEPSLEQADCCDELGITAEQVVREGGRGREETRHLG